MPKSGKLAGGGGYSVLPVDFHFFANAAFSAKKKKEKKKRKREKKEKKTLGEQDLVKLVLRCFNYEFISHTDPASV